MRKAARQGHQVAVAILSGGAASRYESQGVVDRAAQETLREASRQAAVLLGAEEPVLHDLPDNRFDSLDLLDVVKGVEEIIRQVQPEVLYTHHGGDLNIDHALTFRAALTAVRPMLGSLVRELHCFEVPSSSEWAFHQFEPRFQPNLFVDIGESLEDKVAAMALYETESRHFPHPRSPEALRALAWKWGAASGQVAAEAFQTVFALR